MAKSKKNPETVTMSTPRGKLVWPKLDKVDKGTDKFPNPAGSYNTRVHFNSADPAVRKMMAKLDQMMERARILAEEKFEKLPVKARKQLEAKGGIQADAPYSVVYDEDTEEDTGLIEMKFKMTASGTRKDGSKWTAKPDLFDSAKPPKPLKPGTQIWGGSVAIINTDLTPYFVEGTGSYGLTRRLNAVQIIELVQGGQRSASSYGFEGQDDGFDGSDIETSDDADTESGGSEADDDDADF
jgi:hypothetical protein